VHVVSETLYWQSNTEWCSAADWRYDWVISGATLNYFMRNTYSVLVDRSVLFTRWLQCAPCLMDGTCGPHKLTQSPKTASGLVQPFCRAHGCAKHTGRDTDCGTCNVLSSGPRLCNAGSADKNAVIYNSFIFWNGISCLIESKMDSTEVYITVGFWGNINNKMPFLKKVHIIYIVWNIKCSKYIHEDRQTQAHAHTHTPV